jgi:hypothetical protein
VISVIAGVSHLLLPMSSYIVIVVVRARNATVLFTSSGGPREGNGSDCGGMSYLSAVRAHVTDPRLTSKGNGGNGISAKYKQVDDVVLLIPDYISLLDLNFNNNLYLMVPICWWLYFFRISILQFACNSI